MQEHLDYIEYFLDNEYKIIRTDEDVTSDIYRVYNQIQKTEDLTAKEKLVKDIYSKIKIVEFKYGGEYDALKNFTQYNGLIDTIDYLEQIEDVDARLKKLEQIENAKYEIIRTIDKLDIVNINDKADIKNDVLCSINSMFENNKDLLTNEELYRLCIEYYKLKTDDYYLAKAQNHISDISDKIWQHSLTDPTTFQNGQNFKFLIHSFSSGQSFENSMWWEKEMRDNRTSCSLITESFVPAFDKFRRCGFIYPYNSNIVVSGKQDLYTEEELGRFAINNKKFASPVLDPGFLESAGKQKTIQEQEDFDFNMQHNEVLLKDAKPSAVYIIGYGEKDINSDYENLKEMAENMGLPFVEIDMSLYREKQGLDPLGKEGKRYIVDHALLTYFGLNLNGGERETSDIRSEILSKINDLKKVCEEDISNVYINLKSNNVLNKENMILVIDEIIKEKQLDIFVDDIKNDISSKIR